MNSDLKGCDLCLDSNDVVISGISGRFPESDNLDEFAKNLYSNNDLITEDERRWPKNLNSLSNRMGKVRGIKKFDAHFFGLPESVANDTDPQSRLLLETTFEAIFDSGVDASTLRKTNTGVYIGFTTIGTAEGIPQTDEEAAQNAFLMMGTSRAIYANRINFVFDFCGPSTIMDTACASSMSALMQAWNDIQSGACDQAVVGGVNLCLAPFSNYLMTAVGAVSVDGKSRVFDDRANGYVRSEACVTVFLQKKTKAKRIYATILNCQSNTDGYKKPGLFFPSSETQSNLMTKVCRDSRVDPNSVKYFEAHGTGTKAGDPQEVRAIARVFCNDSRTEPLLIGSVKSNVGHSEGASGLVSIAKVLLAFENNLIAANLNFEKPNEDIKHLFPNKLKVITENTPFKGGIVGINSYGIGGGNVNLLLQSFNKFKNNNTPKPENDEELPLLMCFFGRTQESVESFFNFIEQNPDKASPDFRALLNEVIHYRPAISSSGFPYRGFTVSKSLKSLKTRKMISTSERKPICFIFPGFGSQWPAMAKSLMPLKRFSQTIDELALVMSEYEIDLREIILSEDENALNSITSVFVGITAIQIAIIDILNQIDIKPDLIVGHSFGEIASAYSDECLTAREAILCSFFRGMCIEKSSISSGLMIAVGLKWEDAVFKCQKYNTFPACHNFKDSVTISGLKDQILDLEKELIAENIFVRQVRGVTVPFHSCLMKSAEDLLLKELSKVIKSPKKRNLNRWISSSVADNESSQYANPEYFVNNLLNPVLFYEALEKLPQNCIVVEIAPHSLFETGFKNNFGDKFNYFAFLKRSKNEDNLVNFFTTIGDLYLNGLSPRIEKLYPKFDYPVVSGTQSLGSLLNWKHDYDYNVRQYPDYYNRATASNYIYDIQLGSTSRWNFLRDHIIDGTNLFPATGYLMLVWQSFAANKHIPWKELPIHFTNVQIIKGIIISEENKTKFTVNINEISGHFYVMVGSNIVCTGMVSTPNEPVIELNELYEYSIHNSDNNLVRVSRNEWYNTLRVHGYDFGNKFKGLLEGSEDGREGSVRWTGEWISFADSMLHLMPFTRELKIETILVPTFLESVRCDPTILFDIIKRETQLQHNSETKEDIKFSVFYDKKIKSLYSNCLEIRGFQAIPIPRKESVQGLCLERHLFIPNNESEAIDKNTKNKIIEYEKVLNNVLKQTINKLGIDLKNFSNGYKYENYILSETLIDKYVEKSENEDKYSLLKFYNKLNHWNEDEDDYELDSKNLIIKVLTKYGHKLRYDILNNTYAIERLLRTQLDIILENTITQTLKVLEFNNRITEPLNKMIMNWFLNTPLLDLAIDYNLAQTHMNYITEEAIDPNINLIPWNESESKVPKNITSLDLIIYNCISFGFKPTELLKSIFNSVKENGFVLLIIRNNYTNAQKSLDYFLNNEKVDNEITVEEISLKCHELGLKIISTKSDSLYFTTILLRKPIEKLTQNQTLIPVKNHCFESWVEILKTEINSHKNQSIGKNIWLYANDSHLNGILGLVNCLRRESGGEKIRCLFDMNSNLDFSDELFQDLIQSDLVFNVYSDGKWGTFRHLGLTENLMSPIVETKYSYMNCLKRGDLNTIRWFEAPNDQWLESSDSELKPNHVLIEVYYSGINDKNIDYVYNRSLIDPKFAKHECLIGQEFSGLRKDNRNRVMGLRFSGSITTDVVTNSDLVYDIPNEWSLEEAATVPLSYFTCYYSLIIRCDLQENESVLITSAESTSGQAAISICLDKNCRVFGTVDNETQKELLLKKFENKLNKEFIFIANDIKFIDKILVETNGRGVDVILKTKRNDLFESYFRSLKNCGIFLDLNKQQILDNKSLSMIKLRKNITYIAIDVDYILRYLAFGIKPNKKWEFQVKRVYQLMISGLKRGVVIPYSAIVFRREQFEEAFRSHSLINNNLSKIVLQTRKEFVDQNSDLTSLVSPRNWFNPKKVYIITGGLGGFGFQMAVWMIERGAKQIVLTSRTGPKNKMQELFLKRFKSIGASVQISNRDLQSQESTKLLIEESETMGTIGGIFHLAVVLSDNLFESQTSIEFQKVFNTKFQSLLFLDEITRHSHKDLEYFVAFSSISCGRGNPGQSNYGFANSSVERLCEDRRKYGFHGLAIQWGPIDDVGLVADKSRDTDKTIKYSGLLAQRIPTCFAVLDLFLRLPYPVISTLTRGHVISRTVNSKDSLIEQLATYLGTDSKLFTDSANLEDIGVDSLMSVEIQKRLEREFETSIPLSLIKNITISQLRTAEKSGADALKQIFVTKK